MTNKQILKKLEAIQKRIVKERDELRELMHDVEAQFDSANDACENLGYVIDNLSEYV